MAEFEPAVEFVLENEGGLTNDPADPGGITNFGITLPVLRQEPSRESAGPDDIRWLTTDDARRIYRRQWWEACLYGEIADQRLATKIMDMAVNIGPVQAHKVVQRALRAVGFPVKDDGLLGPVTRAAIGQADPDRLLVAMKCEAAGVYRLIAQKTPTLTVFLVGWLNRAYRDAV